MSVRMDGVYLQGATQDRSGRSRSTPYSPRSSPSSLVLPLADHQPLMKSPTRLACMWFMQARSSIPSLGASTAPPQDGLPLRHRTFTASPHTNRHRRPKLSLCRLLDQARLVAESLAHDRDGSRIVTVTSAPNLPMPAADYRMRRCRGLHLQHALPTGRLPKLIDSSARRKLTKLHGWVQ
ncbi:hypothetical protein BO82DRAFT_77731 [Aspergillus uvarum CBS 121591]|uniref:Uncharacterized protein n=1 Tax=Aspergillus uvarum CBS 121591 TaxID=1448315 RepID=A0A319C8D8_9EURO|nr:hypothetical protein BO82DRAFT_77731 [Aspergillus uvarum CBS 121591]PYH81675.1 hypothetical protein BO82DRAFT_77731 [Aspergillus uvarum CBS 121591]